MDDTISRQAAIEAVEKESQVDGAYGYMDTKSIVDLLNDLPSAQPERKKGQWKRHDEIKNVYGGICIECSECGEKYVVQHILDEKYCPNCGARMRGEENE